MKNKITSMFILLLWLQLSAYGAGKIQNADVKSLSEVGGVASRLINDTKLYVSAGGINKQMSQAITDGDLVPNTIYKRNFLINSDFRLWQRLLTATTSKTVANGVSSYVADQWYVKNSLGTSGVITVSQVAAVSDQSAYGHQVQITTAPTLGQTNGTETYQVIDSPTSVANLYNQTASFGIKVKALGAVTQVGLSFMYATSEVKLTTTTGSESLCTVNTSSFVNCSLNNQALGTGMTTAGVVGVRVRITAVSSGNTYDVNNGYVLEQAMMNLGAVPAVWHTAGANFQAELNMAKRFFNKSLEYNQGLGLAELKNMSFGIGAGSTLMVTPGFSFNPVMRIDPSVTFYNPITGAANVVYESNSASAVAIGGVIRGGNAVANEVGAPGTLTNGFYYYYHWAAEAGI